MHDTTSLQKKLVPDLLEVMMARYHILQYLRMMAPIGRRSLASNVGMSERVLRKEVEFLEKQGLIRMSVQGMRLTDEGEKLLDDLEETMKDMSGLTELEQALKTRLDLEKVVIVPGNSDQLSWVKKDMGRACITYLFQVLKDENVIAVAGGTTLAVVADLMKPKPYQKKLLFVPARGGLGEQVENQANSICAQMARKAHGDYHLLHVPDQLSSGTYQSIVEEPGVKEALGWIHSANIVIHGIGEAKTMATRRRSSPELLEKLEKTHAVAEAFGYYLDISGHIVHKVKTIGLQLEELQKKEIMIAVAGGSTKAKAISAFLKQSPNAVLVTDEGAATALMKNFI